MSGRRLCALMLLLATANPAGAQDIVQRYSPKPPPEARPAPHPQAPEPPVGPNDERPIIPEVKAIVFIAGKDNVVTPQAGAGALAKLAAIRGIHRESVVVPAPDAFDRLTGAWLGKPLSLASLNRLVRELILFWRAHDRPVVDVAVPEQDVTSGVLQLIVTEARVGKVRVEGAHWFAPQKLAREVRLKPGDRIRASVLNADLDWLNLNSFRRVSLVYTPGAEAGATDLVLKTEDRLPVRAYLAYDNTGTEPTPGKRWLRDRLQAGFNWGDAFGAGQMLSYQWTASEDFKNIDAHSVSYAIPLPWRHMLLLNASYSRSETDTGATVLQGLSWGGSMRYAVPLPGSDVFTHTLSAGFDWSRSNNNIDFGGSSIYSKPVELRQFNADYQASLKDALGVTVADLSLCYSPGNWGRANEDSRFTGARTSADSNYTIGHLTLERLTRLPKDWSLALRTTGQMANGPLAPGSAFYVGGWDTVRGFDGDIHGDDGVTASAELRTPAFALGRFCKRDAALNQLQLLGFVDYGAVRTQQPLRGEAATQERAGAGVGVRYNVGRWTSFRGDYAWQLSDNSPVGSISRTFAGRAHIGLTVSY